MTLRFTSVKVEIEFISGTWTDVSSYVANRVSVVRIRKGRPTKFDDVGPMQATVVLWNHTGDFMPDNSAGAYWPNVTEGIRMRIKVTVSGTTYTRFFGWIQAWAPDYPGQSTNDATVTITATCALGILGQKKLRSNWVEMANAYASFYSSTCSVFEFTGGSGSGSNALMNAIDYGYSPISTSVVSYTGTNSPLMELGKPNDMAMETTGTTVPDSVGNSNAIGFKTSSAMGAMHLWVKIPGTIQDPSGNPKYILSFRDSGSLLGDIRLTYNAGLNDLTWHNAAGTLLATLASDVCHEQWLGIDVITNGSNAAHTDIDIVYPDGTPVSTSNINWDFRSVREVRLPGSHGLFAKVSYAGMAMLGGRIDLFYTDAFPGVTLAGLSSRLNFFALWLRDVPVTIGQIGSLATGIVTGSTTNRTALDVGQELIRSNAGILYAPGRDATAYFVDVASVRPTVPIATIDLDADCLGPPRLVRSVDARPTRIEVKAPTFGVQVIDVGAESGNGTPQRLVSVNTVNATPSDADTVANVLLRSNSAMQISQITVDLLAGTTDHTAEFFSESTTLGGLFPTARLRLNLPSTGFSEPTRDVWVQGWTEEYGPDRAAVIMDTSPALQELVTEDFVGANNTTLVGSTNFDARIDVNGAGIANFLAGTYGQLSTAAASTANVYARFTTPLDDCDMTGKFQLISNSSTAVVVARASSAVTDGYELRMAEGGNIVLWRNGFSTATAAFNIASAFVDYRFRMRVVDARVYIKVWLATNHEPDWLIKYTDGSPLTGTRMAIGSRADGTNSVARTVYFSSIRITDGG